MLLPDGRALSNPSNAEIAEAAGAAIEVEEAAFDVVIVGAGSAGLSAAVYCASEGLRTVVVDEGGIGGQARSSSLIRNYLGFPRGVSGARLAERAYEQASVFGASFLFMHRATELVRADDRLTVVARRRAAPERRGGDPRRRRDVSPPRRSVARGPDRRRRLLRRPRLGGARADRQGRLRRRWRELGRPGRPSPRPLRAPRHAPGARRIARRRDVALPGARGRGDAEPRRAHRHRGGRRGRGGPVAGAGAARERRPARRPRSPPTRCSS